MTFVKYKYIILLNRVLGDIRHRYIYIYIYSLQIHRGPRRHEINVIICLGYTLDYMIMLITHNNILGYILDNIIIRLGYTLDLNIIIHRGPRRHEMKRKTNRKLIEVNRKVIMNSKIDT